MSKISQNSIDKVKAAIDIVDVISSFVRLEKKGPGYVGVCPFHNDRHPSMRVTSSRQMYKCFVCGAGGDVFDFYKSMRTCHSPKLYYGALNVRVYR